MLLLLLLPGAFGAVSASCSREEDVRQIVGCLNPFLGDWEAMRERKAAPDALVIPVLHYSREELMSLCNSYSGVLGTCFTPEVQSYCGNNSLVASVQALGDYVCEIRDVNVQARFECISKALDAKPICRRLIAAAPPRAGESADAQCDRMESFFKCLQGTIYEGCGVWGVAVLVQAVDSLGCRVPIFKINETGQIELVTGPRPINKIRAEEREEVLRKVQAIGDPGSIHKLRAAQQPQIPAELKPHALPSIDEAPSDYETEEVAKSGSSEVRLPQEIADALPPDYSVEWGPAEIPPSDSLEMAKKFGLLRQSFEAKDEIVGLNSVLVSETCDTEADDIALAPCLKPWFDLWQGLKSESSNPGELFFPVLFYSPEETLSMCEAYTQLLDTCLTPHVLERCSGNPLLSFIAAHTGYVCSVREPNVLAHFACMAAAVETQAPCRDIVHTLTVQQIQSNRCRVMPQFYRCMEEDIKMKCGTRGLSILLQAIEGFGCDVSSMDGSSAERLPVTLDDSDVFVPPLRLPSHKALPDLPTQHGPPVLRRHFSVSEEKTTALDTIFPEPPRDSWLEEGRLEELLEADDAHRVHVIELTPAAEPSPEPTTTTTERPSTKRPTTTTTKPPTTTTKAPTTPPRAKAPLKKSEKPPPLIAGSGHSAVTRLSGWEKDFVPAEIPSPLRPVARNCGESDKELITECFIPLNQKWNKMISDEPGLHSVVFPLFRYQKWDIFELCNMRLVAFQDCLSPAVLRRCIKDPIIEIVESLLGYACGSAKKDFFMAHACLHNLGSQAATCYAHVQVVPRPGLSVAQKCGGIGEFFSCMTDAVTMACTDHDTTISHLVSSLKQFGCHAEKVERKQAAPKLRRSRRRKIHRKPTTRFTLTERRTLLRSEASPEEELPETSAEEGGRRLPTDGDMALVAQEANAAANHSAPTLTYHCTPQVQNYVTSCILPLVGTWTEFRGRRAELSGSSFPLYFYKRGEILEMCEAYANAFLRCDFPIFHACLQFEVVRFSLHHLGQICKPENLENFLTHFDCVSGVVAEMRGSRCLAFVQQPPEAADHAFHRCSGIPEFYRCAHGTVRAKCGTAALASFHAVIRELGCSLRPGEELRLT